MRTLVFIVCLLVMGSAESFSQSYYWQGGKKKQNYRYLSFDAGLGTRMYFGDIQTSGSQFNKIKLAYELGGRFQFKKRWAVGANLGGRGYKGEKQFGLPGAYSKMDGKLWSGSVSCQFSWLPWEDFSIKQFTSRDPISKSNLFLGLGIGASQYNASYVSNYVAAGDSIVAEFQGGSASGIAVFIPFTFGYRHRFNPSWNLGFELTYYTYLSDKIDAFERQGRDSMGAFYIKAGYTLGQKTWIQRK